MTEIKLKLSYNIFMQAGMIIKDYFEKMRHYCLLAVSSFAKASSRKRSGQTTVEYMLMLASIAAAAILLVASFHKKILGGIFTRAGMVLGGSSN